MRARLLAACVLVGGLGVTVRADDAPLDRYELDQRIARTVHDSALLGSELWKEKNYEGCFRLYQGTLMAVQPLLDHRPKLAAVAKDRLDEAEGLKSIDGAIALRKALDAIQKETAESLTPRTTWSRLRGEAGVRAIARDVLLAAATDPKVNLTRGGTAKLDGKTFAKLEQWMVEKMSELTGGPLKPAGPDLKTAFAGVNVTAGEFDAAVGHLDAVLKEYKIPKADADAVLEAVGKLKPQIVGQ